MRLTAFALTLLGGAVGVIGPANAGAPVPGPVVGAGLPLLLIAGAVYLVVRKLRSRNRAD